jgi:hypothetical protein
MQCKDFMMKMFLLNLNMKYPQNFKIIKETLLDDTIRYRVMEFITKRKFPQFWETEQIWTDINGYDDGWDYVSFTAFNNLTAAEFFIRRQCSDYFKQVVNREEI